MSHAVTLVCRLHCEKVWYVSLFVYEPVLFVSSSCERRAAAAPPLTRRLSVSKSQRATDL